ncbi:MAG: ABC transporter ATP-binding protein [Patescibacteria group bacterium]|nr:ABC transporter ATP-binding protein [Patescibacteria group bacterium]
MAATNFDVIKLFYSHIKKYRWLFLLAVFFSLLVNTFDLAATWLYKVLVDILSASGPASSQDRANDAFMVLALIILGRVAFQGSWRMIEIAVVKLESSVMADISLMAFTYVERHSYQFFSNQFTGSLVRKVSRLVRAFEDLTDRLIFHLLPQALLVIGALVITTYKQPYIGLTLSIWVVVFILINILMFKRVQKYNIQSSEKDSEVTGAMADSFSNNVSVKMFSRYAYEENRFKGILDEWRKITVKAWNTSNLNRALSATTFIFVELGVMYYSLRYYALGQLTIGDVVMFHGYLFTLIGNLWNLQSLMKGIFQSFSDGREMMDLLVMPHEIQDVKRAKRLKVEQGGIVFDEAVFSYSQTRTVLKDLSLDIKPGEHVALVGPSGSGKSTIVKLLFRFYDLDSGKISIDGQDIAKVTQDSLREYVSLVPQDPVLFHRTLMDNIRYGRLQATDEEVIAAAKKANCHEFIEQLADGYKTYVGERGIKLSGGERQRVAIARAILKNAPILVLDEATSSLDSESEALIQDALLKLMKGRTTIAIAHRLSTIMQMDRIVVMQNGRIIDQGTHEMLLGKEGMYQKLWNIQAGGFLK